MDLARWSWTDAPQHDGGARSRLGLGRARPDPFAHGLYNALGSVPARQRLALLYYYEEGTSARRDQAIESRSGSAQDDGSTQDMDYDWADEAIHVSFGYTWLKHLLGDDTAGRENQTPDRRGRQIMADFVAAHKDDLRHSSPYFERLYPVVAQTIRDIPDDGMAIGGRP